MKRVCMVAYTHYRSDARPRREAEALVARGDEVDFLALSVDGTPREEFINGVRVIDLPAKRYRGGSSFAYMKSYASFFAQAFATLTRRHLKHRYDVVYAHTMPDFIVFCAAIVKPLGAKVVLDLHDTMPELYQSKFAVDDKHPLIRAITWQERLACDFADRLVCVHAPHKELLTQRGVHPDKLTVLLNVPDPRVFGSPRTNTPSGPPRLVYHGTIAERLGLDVALQAFALVQNRFPEARFDIIGTGDFAPCVHQLIQQLGLATSVRFEDRHFKLDEVPAMLRGATLGVVPNRDDPATRHMLPVKLLEYVYLGIPAVAPRLAAIQHYFDENALAYYTPGDAESMASAIVHLLSHQGAQEAQERSAAAFRETHAWEHMKHDLYAVIDQ